MRSIIVIVLLLTASTFAYGCGYADVDDSIFLDLQDSIPIQGGGVVEEPPADFCKLAKKYGGDYVKALEITKQPSFEATREFIICSVDNDNVFQHMVHVIKNETLHGIEESGKTLGEEVFLRLVKGYHSELLFNGLLEMYGPLQVSFINELIEASFQTQWISGYSTAFRYSTASRLIDYYSDVLEEEDKIKLKSMPWYLCHTGDVKGMKEWTQKNPAEVIYQYYHYEHYTGCGDAVKTILKAEMFNLQHKVGKPDPVCNCHCSH